MIKYRVLIAGNWIDVDYGIQISNDRLAYWVDSRKGIAQRGHYRLHPDTINCLKFKAACSVPYEFTERDTKRVLAI